jgi:hypothetical protein
MRRRPLKKKKDVVDRGPLAREKKKERKEKNPD